MSDPAGGPHAAYEPAYEPAYERVRDVLTQAGVLLQDNPGPMTLDGTNTWLLRAPDAPDAVVVDPGDDDPAHLAALLSATPRLATVLLTHHHHDHAGAVPALHARTGVPVRALDPQLCRGAPPLRDGEVIEAAGVTLRVLATPGHTADSVCLVLDGAAVLTGDTVLGRGTTVVAHPDGALAPYLDSLQTLRALGDLTVLPGHGPQLLSIRNVADAYLAHRRDRLAQVRDALARLGEDATARQVVELVYADVDEQVWPAAELSVAAQLDYLRDVG